MRFVVELTDGVTTQLNLEGVAASPVSVVQPIAQVKDILQATAIDIGVHFYTSSLANNTGSATARLFLESSMQNEDASDALWEPVSDSSGLDFAEVMPDGVPQQFVFSAHEDLGRYLRWRIEIEAASPEITLSTIFKITVLGHG